MRQNNYGGNSVHAELNNGVAFATGSKDREESKKISKKKDVTVFRCKKTKSNFPPRQQKGI